jgi:hypothetical protein
MLFDALSLLCSKSCDYRRDGSHNVYGAVRLA